MQQGFFGNPYPNGWGSAEIQALSQLPIDRTEIDRILLLDDKGAVVTTRSGKTCCLSVEEAEKLNLRD